MDAQLAQAIKQALGSYPLERDRYYEEVFVSVYDYLDGEGSITTFKNDMKQAMAQAFLHAAELGWQDAGNELPLSPEATEWLATMTDAELGYIDLLFQTLKGLRKDGDFSAFDTATARAQGYADTLDRIYNHFKVAAAGSVMLTFVGDDGEESCSDCQRYKGKRHKASWWISHNLIPGVGSDYECGGWNCHHVLVSDDGKVWTL